MFSSPMIVWWAVGTVLLSAVLGEDLASDAQVEGIVGQNLQLKCPFTLNNGDALYKNSWKMLNEGSLVTVYSYYQDPSNPRHPLRHLVNRSEVVCTKKECVLTIERVQAEDEGTYECDIEFDRKVGQSKVFHLSVYNPPEEFSLHGDKKNYQKGDNLSVECIVKEQKPSTELVWQVNGQRLSAPYKVDTRVNEGTSVSRLQLSDINKAAEHFGKKIECVAKSPGNAHQDSKYFLLAVVRTDGTSGSSSRHHLLLPALALTLASVATLFL